MVKKFYKIIFYVRCEDCNELIKQSEIEEIALTKEKICIKCLEERQKRNRHCGYFPFP